MTFDRNVQKRAYNAYKRAYYAKNKDKVRNYTRKWILAHPEQAKKIIKKWQDKNKEKLNANFKRYYSINKNKHYARRLAGDIGKDDKCNNCGSTERLEKHHPDYNSPKFIITLCKPCHWQVHKELRLAE